MLPPLVQVDLDSEEAEALTDLLMGLGAVSATVRGKGGDGPGSSAAPVLLAIAGESTPLWRQSVVTAMFPADADFAAVGRAVRAAFDLPEEPRLEPRPVEDRDWVLQVQQGWGPLALGRGFEVRLPWHGAPGAAAREAGGPGRSVLRLEGGAAFGLGDHPTTQGAAAFLERVVPTAAGGAEGCRVLDYGTGSGVLAICSAMLGASLAVGVDADLQSVESARRSGLLNSNIVHRVDFRLGPTDFDDACAFASSLAQDAGAFDVVVANILRRPLIALAPALAAAARPGAALALTGLRGDLGDALAVREAYDFAFEAFEEVPLEGGWLLVEAQRR